MFNGVDDMVTRDRGSVPGVVQPSLPPDTEHDPTTPQDMVCKNSAPDTSQQTCSQLNKRPGLTRTVSDTCSCTCYTIYTHFTLIYSTNHA